MVGGGMLLTDDMTQGGARPGWFFYIGVDDVDATVEKVTAEGGGVIMPPWTIEGVGRMALVRDPQGNPFYVMRGASDENSPAFSRDRMGQCTWNELAPTHQEGRQSSYAAVLRRTFPHRQPT